MKHKLIETGDADSHENIEDANGEVVLAQCRVCGCAEGDLPTECPGIKIAYETREDIYRGLVDYINGQWRNI